MLLLHKGIELDAKDNNGGTAWSWAFRAGNIDVEQLLLSLGAVPLEQFWDGSLVERDLVPKYITPCECHRKPGGYLLRGPYKRQSGVFPFLEDDYPRGGSEWV